MTTNTSIHRSLIRTTAIGLAALGGLGLATAGHADAQPYRHVIKNTETISLQERARTPVAANWSDTGRARTVQASKRSKRGKCFHPFRGYRIKCSANSLRQLHPYGRD